MSEIKKLVRRQVMNSSMAVLATILAAIGVSILFLIFGHIIYNGIGSISLDFFTQIPKPFGETGGGIGQAIVGTLVMVVMAGIVAIPIGVGVAIYLSEYGRGRLASTVRFCLELLAELPSIVVGVFVWAVLVRFVTGYSGIAGATALVIIMIPIIARSIEEILHLVPDTLREAALALGTPKWKVILKVVIPSVLPGITTGIVLSLARAAGETAPLLLTALGNSFFNLEVDKPMAAVPLQIYSYAISPYDDWHQKAWGGTLILIALVAILSSVVRFYTRSKKIESR